MIRDQSRLGRNRRGSLAYGVAALIVVLGVACASVLTISLQSYLGVARAEQRLQALAGAEGAVALALTEGIEFPAQAAFGYVRVEVSEPQGTPDQQRESHAVAVTVLGKNGEPVMETRHRLLVETDGQHRRFVSMEDSP